ncbi:MAG TPA: STAS domain-containing protein [Casimicrobiaceae bacterium]|nr:STAS domain-containing protein [Casimicrobiaceae bacterium]
MSERRDTGAFFAGDTWSVSGALTIDSTARVLAASRDAVLPPSGIVALGEVQALDSAAVALLLAWKRRAAAEGKTIAFTGIPPSLTALAALYGVEELLASDGVRSPATA